MKEPNIGSPVEDCIRQHFINVLPPDTPIEVIPHTRVWATVDGTLLWDPKNGYSDLKVKITRPSVNTAYALKEVYYLTGPKGSGKAIVESMRDAVELERCSFVSFTDMGRSFAKHLHRETIVISDDSPETKAFNLDNALQIWCRERKIKYFNINLK